MLDNRKLDKIEKSLTEVTISIRQYGEQLMLVKREVEYLQSLCERLNNAPFMKDVEVR